MNCLVTSILQMKERQIISLRTQIEKSTPLPEFDENLSSLHESKYDPEFTSWHSKLSHCLGCSYNYQCLLCVSATLLHLQLPDSLPGKQHTDGTSAWAYHPYESESPGWSHQRLSTPVLALTVTSIWEVNK